MKVVCQLENHFNKPLAFICTNPNCSNSRILCSRCLTLQHKDCWNYTLEIEDIYKKSYPENINWIRNEDIRLGILTLQKYGATDNKEMLLKAFENLLEKEFSKIVNYFLEKTKEIKAKIMQNLQEFSPYEQINIEEFFATLNSSYNFNTFLEILNQLNNGKKDIKQVNIELDEFLKQTESNKIEQQDLQDISSTIYSFSKDYLEVNNDIFDQFRRGIPFEIFDNYPTSLKTWSWDNANKNSSIVLREHNTAAIKVDALYGYANVLGNIEMAEGRYQWEIEAIADNIEKQWIAFGVVETNIAKNSDDFSYKDTIGMCTYGHLYQMVHLDKILDYDSKSYFCDLDLTKGTFTISYQGTLIAREKVSLAGKKFIPFATLYRQNNKVKVSMFHIGEYNG